MTDVVFRKGIKVYLRPLMRADAPILMRWMNDPEVTEFLMRATPVTEREEEEWVEKQGTTDTMHHFGIVAAAESKLIGSIGLRGIHWSNRTASTGTCIGEKEYWGKGYGTEAKMLLLDFAFNTLDLHSILSCVMHRNGRSLAYAKKTGYAEVGRFPEWVRGKDGRRHDEVHLIVTQARWRPLWDEYLKAREAIEELQTVTEAMEEARNAKA